jgi:hypothetical protein
MKYNRRVNVMRRVAIKPHVFAMALHELRKANLNKMIYMRTPYNGTKNAPKGDLLKGEKVTVDMVFNTSDHAPRRRDMKGNYKIAPGMSKEADWERASFMEIIPIIAGQERMMNAGILIGR